VRNWKPDWVVDTALISDDAWVVDVPEMSRLRALSAAACEAYSMPLYFQTFLPLEVEALTVPEAKPSTFMPVAAAIALDCAWLYTSTWLPCLWISSVPRSPVEDQPSGRPPDPDPV
jgi:hypothetical protein